MTQTRKPAQMREKELRQAIFRIECGRAHTKASKLSVASVAREAGVSSALIHNHYPRIAEAIREAQGRSSREQRNLKGEELKAEREKSRALRHEVEVLRASLAKLASINEVLLSENMILSAKLMAPKLIDMEKKRKAN